MVWVNLFHRRIFGEMGFRGKRDHDTNFNRHFHNCTLDGGCEKRRWERLGFLGGFPFFGGWTGGRKGVGSDEFRYRIANLYMMSTISRILYFACCILIFIFNYQIKTSKQPTKNLKISRP